ncbi:hypothetical protein NDU88_006631 [Pleurodeles waltl]|uniref:Uncharacterized protein n=1 Tax=Pleurodeles waltl TaxID=8319 RepID=A0AAV7L7U6_PLEWA|nr:hypothetical protein NDU88_006631 [Pleurodeles waltl]
MQNGALRAVSRQARAPTETPVWTDTYTERSPPGCQPSGEGNHRDSGTDRHLYRMEPSGLSAVRRGHPQRPRYETPVWTDTCTEWRPPGCQPSREGSHRDPGTGCQPSGEGTCGDPGTDRHLYRMEPSGLSAARRGHPQRPWYGQTLVQNGALRAVSCQARAPTETPVRTDTCAE